MPVRKATRTKTKQKSPRAEGFLSGGGEMGERIRALDWSDTPLGSPDKWPQSLRSVVGMMLPSSASICLFWGPEFVTIYNDAYAPVFGSKHPGMLGKPARIAWSEIWKHQLQELLERVVHTGESFHGKEIEFLLERFGFVEETYFDVSYDPVRGESGGVDGVYCIVNDKTGHVIGERRLGLLRDLAAHNSVARTQRDACVLTVQTLAGSKPVPFALAYLGDELQAATPGAELALRNARHDHVRELAIPNGKLVVGLNPRRPFDAKYASFLDLVGGQFATAVANAQAYEEERKRVETLAELDRAKTTFFSNVSHEFRTPLTLMLGPVSELLAQETSTAARASLELIERNALRLHKLVNALLDFSRIEAGRVQARFAPLELAVVTTDLASAFRSVVERAGLTLTVQCDAPRDRTFVDREMWEKIVLNLISNAFKHTFEGGISVHLRAEPKGVLLSVTDTGVGIPSDQVDKVFDRFHRVTATKSRTHEGSGIGLSLVRELVRLHGGSIDVTSTVGQGSTFEVRIPYGHAHLPAEQVSWKPTEVDREEPARLRAPYVNDAAAWSGNASEKPDTTDVPPPSSALAGAEVLIVDDNADMREYIARLIKGAGARVTLAGDGRSALRLMRARMPDLVLSDVMMPELDGFGLLAEVRADERLKSLPFVMLSARAGEESRIGGLSAGADDYLVKPFLARELIARVASQLRLAKAGAAERRARGDADEARREMARVFEQAPVPICVIEGPELLYTTANASYRQIIGNRDPVGRTLLQLWPELDGSEIHKVFQQVLATGKAVSATEFPVQFDQFGLGTRRESFFNFVYHPLADDEGRTRGIIAIATDVTAQVLARREADRLRQLAEEANAAKLHLLRTVSHETRQPVHASLGYLDLLTMGIRGELNEQQRSDIENVRRNQNHLLRLLNDILSFAKLEAGALQLDAEDADVAEIIEAVEPIVAQQFRAKGVNYVSHRPEGPAKFRGDRERTVQVCVNLLSNALKATPPGGSVTLSCMNGPNTVTLAVSDTGIGIPSGKLEEIFDPFTQLARVRSSADAGGVGLGLSISRQLARAMRGDISVESTVGSGSTFTFSLPRA